MSSVIFYEKETDTRGRITLIHNQPYHEKHGLSEERIKEGIEVDSVPKSDNKEGKKAVVYINPQTKEIWYEYEDKKLSEEDRISELEKRIKELENK